MFLGAEIGFRTPLMRDLAESVRFAAQQVTGAAG